MTRIGYNPFFEPREANPLSELPLNKWRERIIATLRGRYLLTGVILAVWLVTIISIATSGRQWDFRTYYYAAIAHAAGENPYDLAVLNKYSQNEIDLPFVYPPLTCYFFRPFTYLPYDTAYQFWLWLKVAIAIYLIWLWRTRFIRWGPLPLMILIVSAAFQSALYRDLASGNVSLLEQAVLWTGFLWLLEQKPYRFALAVVLAALFKVTLAFFLVTALFTRLRNRCQAVVLGSWLLCAYLVISWVIDEQLFWDFFRTGANIKEFTAEFNHSTLAVFHDLGNLILGPIIDSSNPMTVAVILYLAFVVIAAALTFKSLRQIYTSDSSDKLFLIISSLCLLYSLIMPRMKNYSFLLLVVPAYVTITSCNNRKAAIIVAILLVVPRIRMVPPQSLIGFYQHFHPWVMAVVVWGLFLCCVKEPYSFFRQRDQADY